MERIHNVVLQWGHGGDAVENQRLSVHAVRNDMKLQWGHGGDAVENLHAAEAGARTPLRFNGATAATPWRTAGS